MFQINKKMSKMWDADRLVKKSGNNNEKRGQEGLFFVLKHNKYFLLNLITNFKTDSIHNAIIT